MKRNEPNGAKIREESKVPRIYLDVCCLNRPFDDQTQPRIHLEAEAILVILNQCKSGGWEWISSEVVELEISRTPDPEQRRRVQLLASNAHHIIVVGKSEIERAQEFEAWGISAYDALHLACAERGNAEIFLTTDDKLLKKSIAHAKQLRVRVENPLAWLNRRS